MSAVLLDVDGKIWPVPGTSALKIWKDISSPTRMVSGVPASMVVTARDVPRTPAGAVPLSARTGRLVARARTAASRRPVLRYGDRTFIAWGLPVGRIG